MKIQRAEAKVFWGRIERLAKRHVPLKKQDFSHSLEGLLDCRKFVGERSGILLCVM